jgi:hypothetical protein
MELNGVLIHIGEIQTINEFKKREFVIETREQYSQKLIMELQQDRVDLVEPYKLGEVVNVSINIRGKAYQDKNGQTRYFNSLIAWKIQR